MGAVRCFRPALAAELKSWLRFNARAAVETGDGLLSAASGNPALPTFLGGFLFDRFFSVEARPDMLLRFGHAPQMPRSLRRPVAAVIDPRL